LIDFSELLLDSELFFNDDIANLLHKYTPEKVKNFALNKMLTISLFVTSEIEFSNSPSLESKVLQNAFKIKKLVKYFLK